MVCQAAISVFVQGAHAKREIEKSIDFNGVSFNSTILGSNMTDIPEFNHNAVSWMLKTLLDPSFCWEVGPAFAKGVVDNGGGLIVVD